MEATEAQIEGTAARRGTVAGPETDTEPAASPGEAPIPRRAGTGRHLALIDASPAPPHPLEGCVEHLLADFEEAFGVYERVYGRKEPRAGGGAFHIERLRWPQAETEDGAVERGGALAGCSAAVVGCVADGCPALGAFLDALDPKTQLYAVVVSAEHGVDATYPVFDELEARGLERGLIWAGGLAVGGGLLVAQQAGEPRMGRKRRARSEGLDLLIAAVRSGSRVQDLPGMDYDLVEARCSMPRFIYQRMFPTAG